MKVGIWVDWYSREVFSDKEFDKRLDEECICDKDDEDDMEAFSEYLDDRYDSSLIFFAENSVKESIMKEYIGQRKDDYREDFTYYEVEI